MAISKEDLKADERVQDNIVEIPKSSEDVPTPVDKETTEDSKPILDYAGSADKTDPEEIRLVRKLDLCMLPVLWIVNFLHLMQRQFISVAVLGGLKTDLELVGTQFSTAVSVHYAGYILGQIPSNLILTRVRPSLVLASAVLIGAVTTICLLAVNDFTGLVLQRFFLGMTAAPCWPGTLYILTSFYKRKEISTRIGIVYSSNIISTAFQGLIAAPIFSELSGERGLSGWRWLSVILGSIVGFVALFSFFVLPNEPLTTWWLSTREKELAYQRIADDTVEKTDNVSMLRGLKQVIRDKHVWIFCFMHHINTASSSFRNFLPTLLETLGYSTTITLVITAPPYLLSAIVVILSGLSSGKHNERTWHLTALKLTAMTGFILGCATLNTGARLFAAFMFVGANYGVTSITLGWVGITCAQTKEKRAAALALVNTCASVSQVWSPYLWPESASPRYVLPLSASAGMCLVSVMCFITLRLSLQRENKRIRRQDESATLFYAY